MIVGRITDKVEIPHEPGNYFIFRQLSGVEVDDAREARSRKILQKINSVDRETMAAFRENKDEAVVLPTEIPPKDLYDWEYMIEKAVVGWEGPDYNDIAVDGENKTLLDAKTREWAVDYICEKNFIPLVKSTTSEESSTEDT